MGCGVGVSAFSGKPVVHFFKMNNCNFIAVKLPMFKIRRKCSGMPIAANRTAAPLPSGVRGTGAPNPVKTAKVISSSHFYTS